MAWWSCPVPPAWRSTSFPRPEFPRSLPYCRGMADAVVIPGRLFGPGAPLPMYTGNLAESRGATVHRHEWSSTPPELPDPGPWVAAEVTPLLDKLGGRPLLIGKSLGTCA